MMQNILFEELIKYSDAYYQQNKHNGTKCPAGCNHDHNNCSGFCSNCMEELTWNTPNGRANYNCNNLTAYYVCKFLNRFSSEIYHAINSSFISEKLINFQNFNILSLGCGPGSDIIAFDAFNKENNPNPVDIYYRGLDIAEAWQHIHETIDILLQENNYTNPFFKYSDVFEQISDGPIKGVNILVVQNLISTFIRTNSAGKLNGFIDDLIRNVIDYMPKDSVIILNDINSINMLRDKWLSDIITKLKISKRKGNYQVMYFDKNYGNTSWVQHPSDNMIYDYPKEFNKQAYSDWDHCSGVQLLITLEDS